MKPWMTEAIGTQNVVLPSSVVQALLATSEKFSIPLMSLTGARYPLLKRSSDASNGRQVMRSPAVPPSSRELSAALYSVGTIALNVTLMSGCCFSKAGMIWLFQISASSFRQLSMVSVVSASAMPLKADSASTVAAVTARRFVLSEAVI